jgi:hypothetical protein
MLSGNTICLLWEVFTEAKAIQLEVVFTTMRKIEVHCPRCLLIQKE